jgi:hypothetical protein
VIFTEPALIVKGRIDRRGNGVSVTAQQIRALPRAYRRDALQTPEVSPQREQIPPLAQPAMPAPDAPGAYRHPCPGIVSREFG